MCLQHSPEDTDFTQWLLDVGHGRNIDEDEKIDILKSMVTFDEEELINNIYK